MPRNSGGVYTQPTGTTAVAGNTIDPNAFNTLITDISTALTQSININGSAAMVSPLNMGNSAINNTANPVNPQDAMTLGYALANPVASWRNLFINPGFAFDRRNAGVSTTSVVSGYVCDRWLTNASGGTVTTQQIAPGQVSPYMAQMLSPSGTSLSFLQRIEAASAAPYVGKTMTLSFYARCSVMAGSSLPWGVYYASSTNNFGMSTQFASGTLNITTTATKYSVQVTLPPSAAHGIEVRLADGYALGASQFLQFELAQFEVGSSASAFELRPYAEENFLCSRYYCNSYPDGVAPASASQTATAAAWNAGATTSYASAWITFPSRMIQTPTSITVYNAATGATAMAYLSVSATAVSASPKTTAQTGFCLALNGVTAVAADYALAHWAANAEL
jgi:hypothetical protein